MKGRTVVITGGTSGVGLAAAEALARRGARILLVGRDPKRGRAALDRLRRLAPEAEHAIYVADLSDGAETRGVGAAIAAAEPRLDVLANNAGAVFDRPLPTRDGIERTFALNHVSTFILTDALRGALAAGAPSRIVTTSSIGHRFARLDWADLQSARRYHPMAAYCRSKLCNVLFTRELARRLAGTGVTANCFHPGFVASRFGDGNAGSLRSLLRIGKALFAISPERGADTLVHLASSPGLDNASGGYYARRRRIEPSAAARDDEAARRLWDATLALVARSGGARPEERDGMQPGSPPRDL